MKKKSVLRTLSEDEVIIREYENIQKLGILNVETLTFNWEHKQVVNYNPSGFCQKIGNQCLTIFRHKDKLNFLVKKQLIEIDNETESHLKRVGNELVFTLSKNGAILFEQSHKQIKSIMPIQDDPTPFVDAEDFDLRILIHNVLTEKGRRDRIFNTD